MIRLTGEQFPSEIAGHPPSRTDASGSHPPADPRGVERGNELLHEMAHAVLFSHGEQDHPPQYRKMLEHWYD